MALSLPYRAEKYSKANASNVYSHVDDESNYNFRKCRRCQGKFAIDELRLSARVQSFKRDGKDEIWYHCECFFVVQRPSSINEIENFENIPMIDQQKIRKKIEVFQLPIVPKNVNPSLKRPAPEESKIILSDFKIEYSVSSRAECVGCRNKILKGLVRVSKTVYFTEIGMKFGGQAFQHHLECFAKICRKDYQFYLSGDKLPGFKQLKTEDQCKVMEMIKLTEDKEIDGVSDKKKMRLEAGPSTMNDDVGQELEYLIKIQSEKFQTVRETLKINANIKMLREFLKQNNSNAALGYEDVLDRCADFISFGAILKCTACSNGDMIFSKHGYKCGGKLNEWANCDRFEVNVSRQPVKFPKSMNSIREKLTSNNIKFVVQHRAVRPMVAKVAESKREVKVARNREPLYNMHIVPLGKLSLSRAELKQKIESLGGKLTTKLQERIAFVIGTEDEVEKLNMRMQQVKKLRIQVVEESFLDKIAKLSPEEVIKQIQSSEISDWGSDPLTRIPQEDSAMKFQESVFSRGSKTSENVKLKNGSAVDPAADISEEAHVYEREGILYTAVLALVDIRMNKNSYFKIQVLQSDDLKRFWVFTRWGRIGTKIGDKKLQSFWSAEMAISEFEFLYRNQTGNPFDPSVEFQKKSGCFYPVDVDYEEDSKRLSLNSTIPSKLPESVQKLLKLIFNVDNMTKTMIEFQLDLKQMPLGKLSAKQLHEAQKTLSDLNNLISTAADAALFTGLSNKFYTLVPHNLGMRSAPVINTLEMIKEKQEMIESLLQIEIAYSLLQGEVDENANPLDVHYYQLKTELRPLERDSKEFQLLQTYAQKTHAPTHTNYNLIVEEIFEVKREGEEERYRTFESLHNRQLLWHGSRLTNFAGILSNGLKIAPKEAPVSGYMFGKGIYFADMVSKSANYCYATPNNDTGLMLLSEVALGNMLDLTAAYPIKKLRNNYHSVRGLGKTFPNPEMTKITNGGIAIPLGTPTTSDSFHGQLLYNEYIVYDESQVNIKYLLKMKFDFKNKI